MRTESLVCDALLGQGEALDCFNQKLQDIAVQKAQQELDVVVQQINLIQGVDDNAGALVASDKYKKVFGHCCEVAQTGCGCNCSDAPAVVR